MPLNCCQILCAFLCNLCSDCTTKPKREDVSYRVFNSPRLGAENDNGDQRIATERSMLLSTLTSSPRASAWHIGQGCFEQADAVEYKILSRAEILAIERWIDDFWLTYRRRELASEYQDVVWDAPEDSALGRENAFCHYPRLRRELAEYDRAYRATGYSREYK